jgi:hypothetical protein
VPSFAEDYTMPVKNAIGRTLTDYQVPFRFTGTIAKLTFKLGKEQLTEAEHKEMHQALLRAKD